MSSPNQRLCIDCGAELPEGSPARTCARCLLAACFEEAEACGCPEGATEFPSGLAAPGEVFGDYELTEEIARGGMGVVFKARQRSLDRIVALKMMLPGWRNSQETVRRFRIEAEAASRLRHPGIVSIHEVGECAGQHFYSMDYIEGQDLVRRVQGGLVPMELAAEWMRSIAEAIHHAHQHGILHRDLKPANVIIDRLDRAHVTDFGLAKLLDEGRDLTAPGRILGTPSFMPPEQADAQGSGVTVASDVYGLGAIFYFLLTGVAPFQGTSTEHTLRMLLTEDSVPPSRHRPGIPRDLEIICLKCLNKEPQRRYSSAADLAEDLAAWSRREPIRARAVSPMERLWFWARRKPSLAAVSGALIAAILAGAILQQRALNEARRARAAAEGLIQFMNEDLTEQLRPLGRLRLLDNVNRTVQRYYRGLTMNEKPSHPLFGQAQFFQNHASVLRELGQLGEARESARSAIELLERLLKEQPNNPEWPAALAEAHGEMRNILVSLDLAAALEHAREAVGFARRAHDLAPASEPALVELADARLGLASILQRQRKTPEAAAEIAAAIDLLNRAAPSGTHVLERQHQFALCSYYSGLIAFDQGQKDRARQFFGEYLERTVQLGAEEGDAADARVLINLAVAHSHLGRASFDMKESSQAIHHFREYHRLTQRLERQDPGNVNYRRELGFSSDWLAGALEQNGGSQEEIAALLTRSCELFQKLATDFPQGDVWQDHAARSLTRLAMWHSGQGKADHARELLAREVEQRWDLLLKSGDDRPNHQRFIRAMEWSEAEGGPPGATLSQRLSRLRNWANHAAVKDSEPGGRARWGWTRATLQRRMAALLARHDQRDAAMQEFDLALMIWKDLAALQPGDADVAADLAQTFCSVVLVDWRGGNFAQAAKTIHSFADWMESRRANFAGAEQVVGKAVGLQSKLNATAGSRSREEQTAFKRLADAIEALRSESRGQAPSGP